MTAALPNGRSRGRASSDSPVAFSRRQIDQAGQAIRESSRDPKATAAEQLQLAWAGQIHLAAGNDVADSASFREALKIDPFDAVDRQGVATSPVRTQRRPEKIEFFRHERQLAGLVPCVLFRLGEVLLRSGHEERREIKLYGRPYKENYAKDGLVSIGASRGQQVDQPRLSDRV